MKPTWDLGRFQLSLKTPLIMGILNITPDSFSDGGKYLKPQDAIQRAFQLVEEGADILDIGGESTRPGAKPVSPREEWDRVEEVLSVLVSQIQIPISLDTRHFDVAQQGIGRGVAIINDVSCANDSRLLTEVAQSGVGYILMHSRGESSDMMERAQYNQIEVEVFNELKNGLERCHKHLINKDKICVDPGFGFAKKTKDNLRLFQNLSKLKDLGYPLLVGVSRKRMLREWVGTLESDLESDLKTASVTAAVMAVQNGANLVRVHDVKETKVALKTLQTLSDGLGGSGI